MEDELNPFTQMIDETNNKQTDAPVKIVEKVVVKEKVVKEKSGRGRPNTGVLEEKTKSFLLRTDEETFAILQMFAKVKKDSANNIVEQALKEFLTRKDNKEAYEDAVKMVKLLK